MTKLRPPDGRVFLKIDKRHKNHFDATIEAVCSGSDFQPGQQVCVIGKIQRVEIQDVEVYSTNESNIAMVYEQD